MSWETAITNPRRFRLAVQPGNTMCRCGPMTTGDTSVGGRAYYPGRIQARVHAVPSDSVFNTDDLHLPYTRRAQRGWQHDAEHKPASDSTVAQQYGIPINVAPPRAPT